MKLRFRFPAALFALIGLLTFSVQGAGAAQSCSAETVGFLADGAEFPRGDLSGAPHCAAMPMSAVGVYAVVIDEIAVTPTNTPGEAPCDTPGMPGHCPSALSCAVAVLPAGQEIASATSSPLYLMVERSQVPHTRTSPPEIPPPRA